MVSDWTLLATVEPGPMAAGEAANNIAVSVRMVHKAKSLLANMVPPLRWNSQSTRAMIDRFKW
jgi:hypothetical protein